MLALAAGVFALSIDGGAYALTDRTSVAIGIWWTLLLAIALSIWPLSRPPRAALVIGGLLFAVAVFTGLSIAWAQSAERAFAELDRVLLYLGVFAVAVVAGTAENLTRWRDGIALGLTAVGLLALCSRLFGDLVGGRDLFRFITNSSEPLSYPVNYRSGLAILVALAFPLLLDAAVARARSLLGGVALLPLPALVAVIYLASSRGGAAAAVAGTVVFVALTSRRATALWAILCAGTGAAAALAILDARPQLVDGPLDSAAAASQGESAALLIALACLTAGVLYVAGPRLVRWPTLRLGKWAKRALAAGAIVIVIGGVAAADPQDRFETFKRPPDADAIPGGAGYTEAHLLTGSGRGRWQLWESAIDAFETRPAVGRGAGSYESWWTQHGTLPLFLRDAHSLYVETLAELGVVGLCLLLALFGGAMVAALHRIGGSSPERRSALAALTATFAAFALAAAFDWMWELTVVGVVAFACLGLMVGPATAHPPVPSPRRRRTGLRAAVVLAGLVVIVLQAIPLLARVEIQKSHDAVGRGDGPGALEHALAARKLQGWGTSSHLQLALVEEQTGDLPAARASIATAIEHDGSDWRLWPVRARLETKAGQVAAANQSLAKAKRLNPGSPVLASP